MEISERPWAVKGPGVSTRCVWFHVVTLQAPGRMAERPLLEQWAKWILHQEICISLPPYPWFFDLNHSLRHSKLSFFLKNNEETKQLTSANRRLAPKTLHTIFANCTKKAESNAAVIASALKNIEWGIKTDLFAWDLDFFTEAQLSGTAFLRVLQTEWSSTVVPIESAEVCFFLPILEENIKTSYLRICVFFMKSN